MKFHAMMSNAKAMTMYLKQSRPFFRIGLGVIFMGGIIALSEKIFNSLSLTGNDLVHFELWRLVTHYALELNIFAFIWSLWSLYQTASLVEPNWGLFETVKYLALVQQTVATSLCNPLLLCFTKAVRLSDIGLAVPYSTTANILSSILIALSALLIFAITKGDSFFFQTRIYGSLSACSAVYVAIKQYLPDLVLMTTPIGSIKNTHLPACIVSGSSILVAFGLLRWVALLQILFGIQIGWTYLRFLQPHDDGEPKGDFSDHFAWATLFPSKLQPIMKFLSSAAYAFLIRIHLCKQMTRHIDLTQLDSVNVLPTLHNKANERRRQKALRDLTERLNRIQRVEMDIWPEMEEVEENTAVQDISSESQQEEIKDPSTENSTLGEDGTQSDHLHTFE